MLLKIHVNDAIAAEKLSAILELFFVARSAIDR
jgi:hypothetical protein